MRMYKKSEGIRHLLFLGGCVCLLLFICACGTHKQLSREEMRTIVHSANRLGIEIDRTDDHALLNECAAWLGVPYVYGGNSKRGVDCSGLTCAIYNKVYGISLHRRSRDQYAKDIKRKKKGALQMGDLVFFTSPGSNGACGHVGIFLKDDKFIHASSSRGVVVDRLESKYFTRNWLAGGEVNGLSAVKQQKAAEEQKEHKTKKKHSAKKQKVSKGKRNREK